MKTLSSFLLSFLFILLAGSAFAQAKTESFTVSGECKMCKKKIETAAKAAGASYAVWNVDSKKLTVKYSSETSNTAKIQQQIAAAGYDTPTAKASDSAYNNLDECCQYERTAKTADCCADATCCKDGTCTKDAACCKEGSCCTDGKCTKGATGMTSMKDGKASCCAKH